MAHTKWLFAGAILAVAPAAAQAQEAAPPAPATASERELLELVRKLERRVEELERERDRPIELVRTPQPSALESAIRSVSVTGYAEALASWNLRSGGAVAGRRGDTLAYNQLRAGDEDTGGFSFRTLEIAAERLPEAVGSTGFRVAFHYGNASRFEDVDPQFDAVGDAFSVPEANFVWRAPFGPTDHVDLTVGKFRTWLGFETIESASNWLVTRSANIVYGTPVTHTGLRAVAPVADSVEVGVALVNGWDEVRDSNEGKTGIAHVAFGRYDDPLASLIQVNASYGAVEGAGVPQGDKRRLFELLWDGRLSECTEVAADVLWGDMPDRSWHGASAYLRRRFSETTWIAARWSWFADEALGTSGARIAEMSLGLFHDLAAGLTLGIEYRHDASRSRGTFLDASGDPARSQDTITASFLCRF